MSLDVIVNLNNPQTYSILLKANEGGTERVKHSLKILRQNQKPGIPPCSAVQVQRFDTSALFFATAR